MKYLSAAERMHLSQQRIKILLKQHRIYYEKLGSIYLIPKDFKIKPPKNMKRTKKKNNNKK